MLVKVTKFFGMEKCHNKMNYSQRESDFFESVRTRISLWQPEVKWVRPGTSMKPISKSKVSGAICIGRSTETEILWTRCPREQRDMDAAKTFFTGSARSNWKATRASNEGWPQDGSTQSHCPCLGN